MTTELRAGVLVFAMISVISAAPATAQSRTDAEPPGDVHLLVQAELDYLRAVEKQITLQVERAAPGAVLRQIGEKSGLTIEVRGSLPKKPLLSASYRDTKARAVLEWFARQLPVSFRAEPPNKLWVIVDESQR